MKTKASAAKAPARDVFTAICKADLGVEVVKEYTFHPTRKWRFDYAMLSHKIAVEVEGGAWTQGRHTRPKGFIADMEKYNAAALMGWRVLRVTPADLYRAKTISMLRFAVGVK
jgi:very-short-patch-repair endonuclease